MAHPEDSTQDLLQAHVQLLHESLGYIKSTALAVSLDVGIADAIHHYGGSATLSQILAKIDVNPSKHLGLRRLMRMLTVSGIFRIQHPDPPSDGCEALYQLTAASRLLLSDGGSTSLTPLLSMLLGPLLVSPLATVVSTLVRQDQQPDLSAFGIAHGETVWDEANQEASFNMSLHDGIAADTRFLMPIVVKECGEVFQGIDSLVDVGGGPYGSAAAAIAAAFPHLKCSVLDLPHVVAQAPTDSNVQFIAGDMFQNIPPANAIFLKWILHDWGDGECIKLLKRCKQAIPPRDAGGKVTIIDMVLGSGPSEVKHKETQVLFDLLMIALNGVERDEQEWKKIFFEAGFKDYKIITLLGVRSIIELYP
ncbi:5-pentadecatrienyl resorcinol O-methyltransferase [Dichanthelium oligosanthes]|uniref:5-pentadecatrienyl resorcinol O-methyltransferase n=1 Tax=Dichanthelium oligosanthes TaxID=888268 RepID=A0A1E5VRM5_9POAL|nr:5-pentadecatrienyl resorcinol O-methyltransferase [Dichanthelium oligosanthes]